MMVINFFGGPGSGKSTAALLMTGNLKFNGKNAELCQEFAKDLTFYESFKELSIQPFVFGEQYKRLKILNENCDFVVCDSPILLSIVYNKQKDKEFDEFVLKRHREFSNLNFLIKRPDRYIKIGRTQTKKEAISIDSKITKMLNKYGIDFKIIKYEDILNFIHLFL